MAGYNTQALQTPRNTPAVTIVKNQIPMHKCYIMYERSVHVSEKRLQNVVTAVCLCNARTFNRSVKLCIVTRACVCSCYNCLPYSTPATPIH